MKVSSIGDKRKPAKVCHEAGFSVRSVYVLVLKMGQASLFSFGAQKMCGNIRNENVKIFVG